MPDPEFAKYLVSLGVGGTLAAMLFMFYRKDVKQYTELWREATLAARAETAVVVQALREVTIAITLNTEMTRQVVHQLETTKLVRLEVTGPAGHESYRDAQVVG